MNVSTPPSQQLTESLDAAGEEEDEKSSTGIAFDTEHSSPESQDDRRRRQLQEASRRSRKRHKGESILCTAQISAVQREITDLKEKLSMVSASSGEEAATERTVRESVEMQRRVYFLKEKLEEHTKWISEVRNMLARAPLLDLGFRLDGSCTNPREDEGDDEKLRQVESLFEDWKRDVVGKVFSPSLIAQHVDRAVDTSQANALKLLNEFAHPSCAFGVHFASRGWSVASNLDRKLLTFRVNRVISYGTASHVAAAIWKSIQQDDVLRTFVPVVQDTEIMYSSRAAFRCLNLRMVRYDSGGSTKAIITTDLLQECSRDGVRSWLIAIESCTDPCLLAFATESKSAEESAGTNSPRPNRAIIGGIDVVIAARCTQQGRGGVFVELAGSVEHNGLPLIRAKSHHDLVQYLVWMMPVYEELHLLSRG